MVPGITGPDAKVVGFIDIGTHSVRLLLVRLNPNHSYTILSEQKESARLGGGEFFKNRLEHDAIDRTVMVCSKFARMARSFGASRIVTVATAATREANNKRDFLRRLRNEARIDARVVSGKEEARLIYLGVSRGTHLGEHKALFIDVGGGSTELIVGDERDHQHLSSLEVGSIRLSQTFQLDHEKPIDPEKYAAVKKYVRANAVRSIQEIRKLGFDQCIGSSGTIINLAEIASKALPDSRHHDENVLRYDDLRNASRLLCSLTLEKRRNVPGINPNRADIILGGAAIIETLMEQLRIDQLTTSSRSLRDGLLIDFITRTQPATLASDLSTRQRSILFLGRRCGFDEQHARTVARLTLDLFDSSKKIGLHRYTDKERELLGCAAMLHDVGTFLTYLDHNTHSYYLIRNADLIGFDQTEIAIIAALARYHTKGMPHKSDPGLTDLDRSQIQMITHLAVLLRIAETLDRSHANLARNANFTRTDRKNVFLQIIGEGDCALEMWGVQKHTAAFKKAFGQKLSIAMSTLSPNRRHHHPSPNGHPEPPKPSVKPRRSLTSNPSQKAHPASTRAR
jgi:exopolyphosphatase/guanosine-5'-triphosphate,3'-diphosphate pyrophosphatase